MTIYDLAKIAGVSASTISRVINNKPGVSAEKRMQIMKLIEKNKFELNEMARGLSTNVTKMVGILISDIRNSHYTELAYVVETYLQKNEYCSIIINTGITHDEMNVAMHTLKQRGVDGIILIGSIFQNDFIENEIKTNFDTIPVVIANGSLDLPNVHSVMVDEYNGIMNCVDLLYEKGYSNLAYIGNPYTVSNKRKEKGFIDGVTKNGKQPIVVPIESKSLGQVQFEPLKQLITKHPNIDGIICVNDFIAAEAMNYLISQGVKVPQELGVIGINNDKYCEITYPKLTSLDNQMTETGLVTASLLVDILAGKKKINKVMLLSKIIMRESVRK
jgi:DNA-binding LacI/PurR family transcriptional regulator